MKTKIWMSAIILFILIFTVGCVKKDDQANQEGNKQSKEEQSTNQENSSKGESFFGSLKDLMKKGSNLKCTWQVADEGATQKGVMYVSGDKFRQEVVVEGSDTLTMNMISDTEWFYQWSPTTKKGTKMKFSEMEKMEEEMDTEEMKDLDESIEGTNEALNEQINYKCEAWKVDNSMFTSPSDVEFTDTTQALEGLKEGAESMMKDMCNSCESLPEAAKNECLKSCVHPE